MNIDIDFEFEILLDGVTVKLFWQKLSEDLNITEFRLMNELG